MLFKNHIFLFHFDILTPIGSKNGRFNTKEYKDIFCYSYLRGSGDWFACWFLVTWMGRFGWILGKGRAVLPAREIFYGWLCRYCAG